MAWGHGRAVGDTTWSVRGQWVAGAESGGLAQSAPPRLFIGAPRLTICTDQKAREDVEPWVLAPFAQEGAGGG